MSELYKMRQEAFETVSYFGIRLQRQIAAIAGEYPHQMGPEDQERASRDRFYEGLRSELKAPSEVSCRTTRRSYVLRPHRGS